MCSAHNFGSYLHQNESNYDPLNLLDICYDNYFIYDELSSIHHSLGPLSQVIEILLQSYTYILS